MAPVSTVPSRGAAGIARPLQEPGGLFRVAVTPEERSLVATFTHAAKSSIARREVRRRNSAAHGEVRGPGTHFYALVRFEGAELEERFAVADVRVDLARCRDQALSLGRRVEPSATPTWRQQLTKSCWNRTG